MRFVAHLKSMEGAAAGSPIRSACGSRKSLALCLLVAVLPLSCGSGDGRGGADAVGVEPGAVASKRVVPGRQDGGAWAGEIQLVEELSLGVSTGPEQYMFGRIGSVAATDDRIYVLDNQLSRVRIYSTNGEHLGDVGQGGQGPGEFDRPNFIDVDENGRLYVQSGPEVEVFGQDGEHLATWTLDPKSTRQPPAELSVAPDGTAFVVERTNWTTVPRALGEYAVAAYRDGRLIARSAFPEVDFEEAFLRLHLRSGSAATIVPPFSPRVVRTVSPTGTMVVGAANEYVIALQGFGGAVRVIEKEWDPVPVSSAESAWHKALLQARLQRSISTSGWDPGSELPGHHPAFQGLMVDEDGRLWVVRAGPSEPVNDCAEHATELAAFFEEPCWQSTYVLDVFSGDGGFLGSLELPEDLANPYRRRRPFAPRPYIDGDILIAVSEDVEFDYVKKYRIVMTGGS